uniref:Uncharacterized protein n=1 Tax=Helianthus annuus TaxID=4232 RepID=A0A251TJJ8_HELAN
MQTLVACEWLLLDFLALLTYVKMPCQWLGDQLQQMGRVRVDTYLNILGSG